VSEYPPVIVLLAGFSDVCIVGPDDEVLMEYSPLDPPAVSGRSRFAQPIGAITTRPAAIDRRVIASEAGRPYPRQGDAVGTHDEGWPSR
jgi:hypothetical protein